MVQKRHGCAGQRHPPVDHVESHPREDGRLGPAGCGQPHDSGIWRIVREGHAVGPDNSYMRSGGIDVHSHEAHGVSPAGQTRCDRPVGDIPGSRRLAADGNLELSDPRGTVIVSEHNDDRGATMSIQTSALQMRPTGDPAADPNGDHRAADPGAEPVARDFACLVSVTHLSGSDARTLRRVRGVTGVIDTEATAEVHMIVGADSHRAARRVCVEQVALLLPGAVVTVPEVVDYNHALLAFLEQHGEHPDDPDDLAYFHDAHVVAEVLDRV